MSLIRQLKTSDPSFERQFAPLEQRRDQQRTRIEDVVAQILDDVRSRGDAALVEATRRFDGYALAPSEICVSADGLASGAPLAALDDAALREAAERIRRYHALRAPEPWRESADGLVLGQLVRPLARVALYVPGGRAPLGSTVLMLGMPARVAGVPELAMCSPGRELHPVVRRAAQLTGVGRLYRIGGAQAVAALAYGTESVVRVDKIVGPGNVYVQEAKRQVFGQVAIDAEAGPSEVFIVADADAPADYLAADLLAQAEHDPLASVVLATPEPALAERVMTQLQAQWAELGSPEVARSSLADRSAIVLTRDLDEALELANRYAAEHLQLLLGDPERWLERVEHAGAVFLGAYSAVPLGDYVAGPSHVLPTGGTARFFSVLGVDDFVKRTSLIAVSPEGLDKLGPSAVRLARLEGLEAHARAVERRLRRRAMETS